MLELIIIIIIIIVSALLRKAKNNKPAPRRRPPAAPPVSPKKPVLSQREVAKKVNRQIFGTENLKDRTAVYNRLLLTDRYQDMEKIGHELGISKYKVLREIKELKKQGHYPQIELDERNYRLIYPSSSKYTASAPAASRTSKAQPEKKSETQTFVQPSAPYRPPVHSGERYEEWMPVPAGKRVIRCEYCGADNLISEKQDPHHCTCYFCREEL